jgi:hypothetical protein
MGALGLVAWRRSPGTKPNAKMPPSVSVASIRNSTISPARGCAGSIVTSTLSVPCSACRRRALGRDVVVVMVDEVVEIGKANAVEVVAPTGRIDNAL